jgi:hypothetical protein
LAKEKFDVYWMLVNYNTAPYQCAHSHAFTHIYLSFSGAQTPWVDWAAQRIAKFLACFFSLPKEKYPSISYRKHINKAKNDARYVIVFHRDPTQKIPQILQLQLRNRDRPGPSGMGSESAARKLIP